jgi:GntR family transcriptional regulator
LITIDYKSRVPIYDQITGGIIRLKTLGVLKEDDKLPSVRSLATELGINPNTVQKAYSILENDGVIYSVSGKGSFISGDSRAAQAILTAAKGEFQIAAEQARRMGLNLDTLVEILHSVYKGGNSDD